MSTGRAERLSRAAFLSVYGDRAVDLDGTLSCACPRRRPCRCGLRFSVSVSPDAAPAAIPDWLQARRFEPGWGWMASPARWRST